MCWHHAASRAVLLVLFTATSMRHFLGPSLRNRWDTAARFPAMSPTSAASMHWTLRDPSDRTPHEADHRPAAHHSQQIDDGNQERERACDAPVKILKRDDLAVLQGEDTDRCKKEQEDEKAKRTHRNTSGRLPNRFCSLDLPEPLLTWPVAKPTPIPPARGHTAMRFRFCRLDSSRIPPWKDRPPTRRPDNALD